MDGNTGGIDGAAVQPTTESSTCLLCLHTVRWLCCAHSQCPECQGALEGWMCGMCRADIREADAYLAQPVDAVLPAVVDLDDIPW